MATKFSLFRPTALPFFTFYSPPRFRFATKRLLVPLVSFATTHHRSFLLHSLVRSVPTKGLFPFPLEAVKHTSSGENITSLDEAAFTRVFDISALRVPSSICSTLENRLRGHLLNWPRIRNIARVPGDEIDDQLKSLLPNSGDGAGAEAEAEDENLVALNRRIYGKAEGDGEPLDAVLYRDKLARTFNSRGYANFRNLAKMSRPKKKKKRDDREKMRMKGVGKNEMAVVQVVEDEDEESDGEELSRLLGEDVRLPPKWRGSTRLLLLDEQLANKSIEELPEAIKVVFQEHDDQCMELVKCKLTLFYDYWELHEVFNMDGRRFIETVFASERTQSITQVVMHLPKDAAEFLDAFRGIFEGNRPGKEYVLPRIHVYGFSKAQDPEFDFHECSQNILSIAKYQNDKETSYLHPQEKRNPGQGLQCMKMRWASLPCFINVSPNPVSAFSTIFRKLTVDLTFQH
ncbi:UNVERIFIED_CONTAM: tRNA (guanine(37)-N1)-methyltransferase 1 [Sesamum radiatum]|uniref:tRNA (Guanine(37)-N1)-methyltransferase 1 n=1 Tax=Sesamum radiatum TaxID=300843 RepID=A0AAW2M4D7_SESRA